jgi:hypothetical protein
MRGAAAAVAVKARGHCVEGKALGGGAWSPEAEFWRDLKSRARWGQFAERAERGGEAEEQRTAWGMGSTLPLS